MDQTRILIYLIGALVLLFFLAFGFRKHADSASVDESAQEPDSHKGKPELAPLVPPIAPLSDDLEEEHLLDNQSATSRPSILGFESSPSKERAINDFIAKMGREAALNEDKKEGAEEQDLPSKLGKQNWSRMVHETFQQRANLATEPVVELSASSAYNDQVMVMNIFSPSGFVFAGLDIVEVLEYHGFVYQEPGFFNRCDADQNLQFRVVSAVGDGLLPRLTLDRFETTGLSFFMELAEVKAPRAAFRQMLTDAHEINYALSGSLKDEMGQPLSQQSVAHYLARIKSLEEARDSVNA